jgi:hypothetical protein
MTKKEIAKVEKRRVKAQQREAMEAEREERKEKEEERMLILRERESEKDEGDYLSVTDSCVMYYSTTTANFNEYC